MMVSTNGEEKKSVERIAIGEFGESTFLVFFLKTLS